MHLLLQTPIVSVIIPTFNSERTIGCCLRSVKNQSYSNIEIIVVDRFSKDRTLNIARKFGVRIILKGPERSAQKNYGAKNANGLFLLFVDSDMELSPKVVGDCVETCYETGADTIIIPQVSVAEGFLAECRKMERDSYIGDNLFEAPRFLRKSVFLGAGGYDKRIIYMEDADLYLRLKKAGYKTCRIQSRMLHHEGRLSMRRVVQKAYYYGKNLPLFIKKNPELALKRFCPLHSAYIKNMRLLIKYPTHFVSLIFMKFCEYIGYSIGILAYYLGAHNDVIERYYPTNLLS